MSDQNPYGQNPYDQNPGGQNLGGQNFGGQPPYGQAPGGYGAAPQPHGKSTTVLIIGILSLICCGLLGPVAWVMGKNVVAEIDASNGALSGRESANIGKILGIVATVLLVVAVVGYALLAIVGISVGSMES